MGQLSPLQKEGFETKIDGDFVDIWEHGRQYPTSSAASYVEVESEDFEVEWKSDIEYRSWGIKGLTPRVERVTGNFILAAYDSNHDILSETQYRIDSNLLMKDGWEFKNEGLDELDCEAGIRPQHIAIDYKDKTIEIDWTP